MEIRSMKYTFKVDKMDCPCEERLIRMKLEGQSGIEHMEFDLQNRMLEVYGDCERDALVQQLESLNLGSHFISEEEAAIAQACDNCKQRRALWWVLGLNFAFFVIEMATGLYSRSMGLVADSLDMLADALVYGMSLMVVGAVAAKKIRVAKFSGYFQIALAVFGMIEVVKRFIEHESIPNDTVMIVVSILALIANAVSLVILQRTRSKEAHIQASIIFSSNDVVINLGVIVAGLLVKWLDSQIPDLIVGTIIFGIVISGAVRILSLAKK